MESLGLEHDFLTSASRTVFFIGATLASTLVTGLLHLHLHESHVLSHRHRALSIALGTGLCFASFSTRAFTLGTVDISLNLDLLLYSVVEVFERDLELELVLWSLSSVVTPTLVPFNLILALLVVNLAFYVICQYLFRPADLTELLSSLFVTYHKKQDLLGTLQKNA